MREILARLRSTYCRSIGIEFMHLAAPVKKAESKPSYFGGIDYVKAPMVVAPIIKKKKLAGKDRITEIIREYESL